MSITSIPIDTRRKLNVHKTFRASSERLMYVQFTFCVYWDTKTRFESLTHFTPMFHFYTPCGFLTFSGIWKWNTCREMCFQHEFLLNLFLLVLLQPIWKNHSDVRNYREEGIISQFFGEPPSTTFNYQ